MSPTSYQTAPPRYKLYINYLWLREVDLNHRSLGYEPSELTGLLYPASNSWCPMTESNCHPRITKPMFYHLTNGAKIFTTLFFLLYTVCYGEYMVDRNGIEPFLKACKALVPPTTLTAHIQQSNF